MLNCGDIFLNGSGGSVFVRNGKCGKQRVVRFGVDFGKIVNEFLAWKRSIGESVDENAPLFISSITRGYIAVRTLQKMFEKCTKPIGLWRHSIHHLRHTYASFLYKASNYNLRLVQKQLGHSSIKTTEVYADVFNPDIEAALKRLYK